MPVPNPNIEQRAVFTDGAAFESYIGELVNLPKSALELREQQNGYPTLRAYLDGQEDSEESALAAGGSDGPTGNEAMALEMDGVTREDFVVDDALLSVLNQRGEVQIGGSVFKVTRDNVYEVAPGDLALLNEKVPTLSSPTPAEADERIGVHPVETTQTDVIEEPALSRLPASSGASFNIEYETSGSFRLRASSYITNLYFYSEMGVNTTWQRHKKFLFFSYWANTWQPGTLSYRYNATYRVTLFPANTFSVSGDSSATGVERIHKTLVWRVGNTLATTLIRGSGNTTHTVSNPTMNTTLSTHF